MTGASPEGTASKGSRDIMNSGEVFVVEDDVTARNLLSAMLGAGGYEVVSFVNGPALLMALRKRRPRFVLLDICLPGESGLDILRQIRATGDTVPVIMASGHGTIDIAVEALRDGAMDFVQKPFRPRQLMARIEAVLDRLAESHSTLPRARVAADVPGGAVLTSREKEILAQVLLGKSAKETGRLCGISYRTVEDHRASINRKTGAKAPIDLFRAMMGPDAYNELIASIIGPGSGNTVSRNPC
jgi:FixJ family two-component response regulator